MDAEAYRRMLEWAAEQCDRLNREREERRLAALVEAGEVVARWQALRERWADEADR